MTRSEPLVNVRRWLLIYTALPLAYLICGRLGLLLAVPPGYATAVFLPAGIAVAAAFMMGAASLPGTFLGSFLLNLWIGYSIGHEIDAVSLATAADIACASMLQAATAGVLLRRVIGYPAPLDNPRDLLFYLLLTPCFCLTSASVSIGGMWVLGVVRSSDIAINWLSWWVGDTLGVLVVLPLMLVLAGEPRRLWRPRVFQVAVPMILCFALFVVVFVRVRSWEQDLETAPSVTSLAQQHGWQSWAVLAAGVLGTGLLGALLMLATGHTYRMRIKEEELEAVLHLTPFMLTRCGTDMRFRFVSESYAAMLGRRPQDIVGKPIVDVIGEKAFATILPHVENVLAGNPVEYECEIAYKGISARIVRYVYTPDKNEHGEVVGWVASLLDVTDQKQAQEREKTLLLEIEHRSNNLLAVVQTIAHRSLAGGQSLDDAKKAFESRLQALARANRQLTKSNWRGVDLREIVELEMEPFGRRSIIDGVNVMLGPREAQNFSLALHELATNSSKYGALSNRNGNIEISWTTITNGKTDTLKFYWREQGGPLVSEPVQYGFGTALLKVTFPVISLDYAPEGLNCEIELPLTDRLLATPPHEVIEEGLTVAMGRKADKRQKPEKPRD